MNRLKNLEEEFAEEYVLLRKSVTCSICLEVYQRPVCLPCQHGFCEACITTALKVREKCPICTAPAKKGKLKHVPNLEETLGLFRRLLNTIEQSLRTKKQNKKLNEKLKSKLSAVPTINSAVMDQETQIPSMNTTTVTEMTALDLTQHSSDSENENDSKSPHEIQRQPIDVINEPVMSPFLNTAELSGQKKSRASAASMTMVGNSSAKQSSVSTSSISDSRKKGKKRALEEALYETQSPEQLDTHSATTAVVENPAVLSTHVTAAITISSTSRKGENPKSHVQNRIPFVNNEVIANGNPAKATPEPPATAPSSSSSSSADTDAIPSHFTITIFNKGDLVTVLPRTWAGINKLGGVGKVEGVRAVNASDETVDIAPLRETNQLEVLAALRFYYKVKYVLDGHYDDDIPAAFVEKFEELSREGRRRTTSSSVAGSTPISKTFSPNGKASSSSNVLPPSSTKSARGKKGLSPSIMAADKENETPAGHSGTGEDATTALSAMTSATKRKALKANTSKNSAMASSDASALEKKPPLSGSRATTTTTKASTDIVLDFDDNSSDNDANQHPDGIVNKFPHKKARTIAKSGKQQISSNNRKSDDTENEENDKESLVTVVDQVQQHHQYSSLKIPKTSSSSSTKKQSSKIVEGASTSTKSMTLSGHKRKPQSYVLLTTCIDEDKAALTGLPGSITSFEQALTRLTQTCADVTTVTHFTSAVTHVIVSVDKQGIMKQRTMKYMQGLAHGVWIVSTKWLYACLNQQCMVAEEDFEVKSNLKALIPRAPMRARQAMFATQNQTGGLFAGYVVVFFGLFPLPGPARSDLEDLVQVQGAKRCFTHMSQFWEYFRSLRRHSFKSAAMISSSSDNSATATGSGEGAPAVAADDNDYPTIVIVRSTTMTPNTMTVEEEENALLANQPEDDDGNDEIDDKEDGNDEEDDASTALAQSDDLLQHESPYFEASRSGRGNRSSGSNRSSSSRSALVKQVEINRCRRYLQTFPQVSALWIMDSITNYEIQPFVSYYFKSSSAPRLASTAVSTAVADSSGLKGRARLTLSAR